MGRIRPGLTPTRRRAAELANVTTHKVRQAHKVHERAPELHERVKAGVSRYNPRRARKMAVATA